MAILDEVWIFDDLLKQLRIKNVRNFNGYYLFYFRTFEIYYQLLDDPLNLQHQQEKKKKQENFSQFLPKKLFFFHTFTAVKKIKKYQKCNVFQKCIFKISAKKQYALI